MSEPFIGEIRMFGGNFAPRAWALCDGQLLAVSQNDALFSLLGTIYGGDGRTTFGLPDLRGRLPLHLGQGPGLSNRPIGSGGGAERVTLVTGELPQHRHGFAANSSAANADIPANTVPADTGTNSSYIDELPDDFMRATANTGGSQQHNNMMPYQCVTFIIALFGIYPSRT